MRYVAFLRAVNVGGRTVKMDRLKASCEALDLANVATFIASGNVVFDSRRRAPALERLIEARLDADFGFAIRTMIRSVDDLREVQAYAATRTAQDSAGSLHVGMLKSRPSEAAVKATVARSNEIDRLSVHGRELYWSAARGFAESTLSAAKLETLLETSATLRNINTIDRILARFGNG